MTAQKVGNEAGMSRNPFLNQVNSHMEYKNDMGYSLDILCHRQRGDCIQ
jgi:hypothetical protein